MENSAPIIDITAPNTDTPQRTPIVIPKPVMIKSIIFINPIIIQRILNITLGTTDASGAKVRT
jgi:hypothetical protein